MSQVPVLRLRALGSEPARPEREYVLYWMIANRRLEWNFALERAVEHARELSKPLVILEALRCGYRWASDRLHRFVIDGMADHQTRLDGNRVAYYPYVEPREGAGSGLLEALADRACVVVTDDFPCFFLPRMVEAAAGKLDVRLEAVDSNGWLPMRQPEKYFSRAYDLRRHLQKVLPDHLGDTPREHPMTGAPLPQARIPASILKRWPAASSALLSGESGSLADLPIDHTVAPAPIQGGPRAAAAALERFLEDRLGRYGADRNQPSAEVTSGLSPYLHFGHISSHQVVTALLEREGWTPDQLSTSTRGSRTGWWGTGEDAEGYLDQIVTWREVGYNGCVYLENYDSFDSLPAWALKTMSEHAGDPRPELYTPEQLEAAETDSEIWNAAQRQLVSEGVIHNYLRMVWGKKIYEWSETPQQALEVMIDLNNKYALDGRNPNSYSGIFWCLGRYDRAWGPERPIFGKLRYMSLESTRRKLRLSDYLERWGRQRSFF